LGAKKKKKKKKKTNKQTTCTKIKPRVTMNGGSSSVVASMRDIARFLASNPDAASTRPSDLTRLLEAFVAANDDPARSANFANRMPDDVEPLARVLDDPGLERFPALALLVLRALKILSRKAENRRRVLPATVRAVTQRLTTPPSAEIASEAANVVLNVCYEKGNVDMVLDAHAVAPLVSFLGARDHELCANAAGAIQSICFQETGKKVVRDLGAIPGLVQLLKSANTKVRTRACGAIHNLSTDVGCITLIRGSDGIPTLVKLLRAPEMIIAGSAAGAVQNLAREDDSRKIIVAHGAIEPLADLLVCRDIPTQAAALGALMNILGPSLGPQAKDAKKRIAFRKLLTTALVAGISFHGMFSEPPDENAISPM
jgi:hypothetical protein